MTEKLYKTLSVRVKDKHAPLLLAMARDVNRVFNFCNETSSRASRERNTWLSNYELQKLTSGYSKCEGTLLPADSVGCVCKEFVTRRRQAKQHRLNWRVSNRASPRYSLGWVPFRDRQVTYQAGQVAIKGHRLSLWDSYGLAGKEFRSGCFAEDSRGRWYFNAQVEIDAQPGPGGAVVGIDLGLKDCATTSAGERLEGRWLRANEQALATAQRARKKGRTRAIHAKIRNQRKDALHKFSTDLVRKNAAIFVGDVASAKLVKTKMAKSTLDAGWSMLKTMLEYKSHQAGVIFEVVNEAYSTQTCSCCGVIPASSPKGRAGLGIREWKCDECETVHDRDVNAARNILAAGHCRLAGGIPAYQVRVGVKVVEVELTVYTATPSGTASTGAVSRIDGKETPHA